MDGVFRGGGKEGYMEGGREGGRGLGWGRGGEGKGSRDWRGRRDGACFLEYRVHGKIK